MSTSVNGSRTGEVTKLDRVVIRFAGDSGDGMQLTGDRFTSEAAAFGNDLNNQPKSTLFFAAGPDDETHGVYGSITPTP